MLKANNKRKKNSVLEGIQIAKATAGPLDEINHKITDKCMSIGEQD